MLITSVVREFMKAHWKHMLRNVFLLLCTPFLYRGCKDYFGSARIAAVLAGACLMIVFFLIVAGFVHVKAKAGRLDSRGVLAYYTWSFVCLSAGMAVLFVVALPTRRWPVLAGLACLTAILVISAVRGGLAYTRNRTPGI